MSFFAKSGPFKHNNARRYLLFTTFYNARAYYPILAIFFLDLGLSLSQFVALNMVWAATILLLEVPSGALADTLGRKRLLIVSSILMIIEMLILCFAPKDGGMFLLILCAVNRILSGASEAAASGANQALAYDTLAQSGESSLWDELLATTMRIQSLGFVAAMVLGGILYDATLLNQLTGLNLSKELTMRLPIFLVLVQSIGCLFISLGMEETANSGKKEKSMRHAFNTTLKASSWVFRNRVALTIVLAGLLIDPIARNFATLTSQYFRTISFPEWSFGFLGAVVGLGGVFIPTLARKFVLRYSMLTNFAIVGCILFIGLIGISYGWNYWGLLPALLIMSTMSHLGFLISYYMNHITKSDQRATVLSVKGLIYNLAYGTISLAYASLVSSLRGSNAEENLDSTSTSFLESLRYFPPLFILCFVLYFTWAKYFGKSINTREFKG